MNGLTMTKEFKDAWDALNHVKPNKRWAASIAATNSFFDNEKFYDHDVVIVEAVTYREAMKLGMQRATEAFTTEKGWYNHECILIPIPALPL